MQNNLELNSKVQNIPCSYYFEEYKDCNSIWTKFVEKKYANLKTSFESCEQWKIDFQNCKLWTENKDIKALIKLQNSNKQRWKRYHSHKTKAWDYKQV